MYELFSKCGEVKRIIMGLDRVKKTPCGFSFVEYYNRRDAEDAMKYLNGSKLDERIVRTDWDPGYREGRQYGRGKSGGQVRDEYRQDFDSGRGGWGHEKRRELSKDGKAPREMIEACEEVASGAPRRRRTPEPSSTRKRGRSASPKRDDNGSKSARESLEQVWPRRERTWGCEH